MIKNIKKCPVSGCNGEGNRNKKNKTHRSVDACPNISKKKTIMSPIFDKEIDLKIENQQEFKTLETKLRQAEENLRRLENEKIFSAKNDDLNKEIVILTER